MTLPQARRIAVLIENAFVRYGWVTSYRIVASLQAIGWAPEDLLIAESESALSAVAATWDDLSYPGTSKQVLTPEWRIVLNVIKYRPWKNNVD